MRKNCIIVLPVNRGFVQVPHTLATVAIHHVAGHIKK